MQRKGGAERLGTGAGISGHVIARFHDLEQARLRAHRNIRSLYQRSIERANYLVLSRWVPIESCGVTTSNMTRYLTPSKVGLLALISIYADGVVPNEATIPVLAFLVSFLLPSDPSDRIAQIVSTSQNHVIPIDRFRDVLSPLASSKPGRTIWDLFLDTIWSLDCCDALDTFITGISSLVARTREQQKKDLENGITPDADRMLFSRASPLGVFIRRVHLEYTRIQFHDTVGLWQNFIAYRLSTKKAWEKRNTSDQRSILDVNLSYLQIDDDSKLAQVMYRELSPPQAHEDYHEESGFSTQDVERLLEFQVGEMQRRTPGQTLCTQHVLIPVDRVGQQDI